MNYIKHVSPAGLTVVRGYSDIEHTILRAKNTAKRENVTCLIFRYKHPWRYYTHRIFPNGTVENISITLRRPGY